MRFVFKKSKLKIERRNFYTERIHIWISIYFFYSTLRAYKYVPTSQLIVAAVTQVWRTSKWPPKLNKDLKWRPLPRPNLKMEVVWRPRKMGRTWAKNPFGFYLQKRSKLKEEKKAKRSRTKLNSLAMIFLISRVHSLHRQTNKRTKKKSINFIFLRLRHAVQDKTACYFSFLMAFFCISNF